MSDLQITGDRKGLPLITRIEETFDALIVSRQAMDEYGREMRDQETDAKLSHEDEYVGAKNGEVRSVLMARWLSEDGEYQEARHKYLDARRDMRLATINVERLKLLVAADGFARRSALEVL